jgi:hypothetical protein
MKWLEFVLKVLIVCVITTLWLLFAGLAGKNAIIQFIRHRTVSWQEQEQIVRQELSCQSVRDYIRMGKEEYGKGRYEQALKTLQMAEANQQYLIPDEREQLKTLLDETQAVCNVLAEKKRERKLK